MSTHNICFYEEISKIIPKLSSIKHLISSSVAFVLISGHVGVYYRVGLIFHISHCIF